MKNEYFQEHETYDMLPFLLTGKLQQMVQNDDHSRKSHDEYEQEVNLHNQSQQRREFYNRNRVLQTNSLSSVYGADSVRNGFSNL